MIVRRRRSSGFLAILGISALVGSVSQAQGVLTEAAPRRPRGIYAVVSIAEEIKQQQKANPSITPPQLHAYFANLYQDLLDNPAVSGLTLQVHWDLLNPRPPSDLHPPCREKPRTGLAPWRGVATMSRRSLPALEQAAAGIVRE